MSICLMNVGGRVGDVKKPHGRMKIIVLSCPVCYFHNLVNMQRGKFIWRRDPDHALARAAHLANAAIFSFVAMAVTSQCVSKICTQF